MLTTTEPAWREFCRRKRVFWSLFLLYMPVMVLIAFIVRELNLDEQWSIAAAVFWLAAWGVAGIWLSRFRCPSCDELFFLKRGVGNVWSNTCRHCRARAPRAAA